MNDIRPSRYMLGSINIWRPDKQADMTGPRKMMKLNLTKLETSVISYNDTGKDDVIKFSWLHMSRCGQKEQEGRQVMPNTAISLASDYVICNLIG